MTEQLACRLDPRRYGVAVYCTRTFGAIGQRLRQKLTVFEYRMQRKWDVRVLRWLKRRLDERRADILIVVGGGEEMYWGRLAARLAGVPVVISALSATGRDATGRLNRLLTRRHDATVADMKPHVRYSETERLPADKAYVIINGVDTERFRPREASRDVRQSLCIPESARVVGTVARLAEDKNHELFLRVAKRVKHQLPNAHFLVVGDGPRRGHLEKLVDKSNIADCTHFTGERADVDELLALMDVFLLTSHNEACPLSALEAMSSGIPVVAARIGSVAETIIDGQTGYLVSRGDESAMSQRVAELLTDSSLRTNQGQAARRHIVDHLSIDITVRGYEQLMTWLLSGKVGEPAIPPRLEGIVKFDGADRRKPVDVEEPLERV